MTRSKILLAAATCLACSCATAPASPQPAAEPPPPPPPVSVAAPDRAPAPRQDGRLPAGVTPTRYALELQVDPRRERFSGTVRIEVAVEAPTFHVVLHGRDLTVHRAVARVGGRELLATVAARSVPGELAKDELALTFPERLPAGPAAIELSFDAPFAGSMLGAFRLQEEGRWYAFTQFEATHARNAFPCFDEPGFRTPFELTLTVPKGMLAFANSPEAARAESGDSTRFRFAPTKPLSTYLVAFAVGELDVLEGPTSPVPLRVIAPKGRAALGRSAIAVLEAMLKELGRYFGTAYPFEKLDVVAVPDFSFGGMENAGLIIARDEYVLLEDGASVSRKRSQAWMLAHEAAHQWFGDLVTLRWWDDTWLNEGFATWISPKVLDRWKPEYQVGLAELTGAQDVMDLDALPSATPVRFPVRTPGEALEAFSGFSYDKSGLVIGMLERWLGEDVFKKGVRDYLQAHAFGNATAEDLIGALTRASGKDVSKVAASFLDQPGVPVLEVRASCEASEWRLDLRQDAWRPLGAPEAPLRLWNIPICVRSDMGESCAVLDNEHRLWSIERTQCPKWFHPNDGAKGYYRFELEKPALDALLAARGKLPVAERVGILANLWALVRAGRMEPPALFEALAAFDRDRDLHVTNQVIGTLRRADEALVTQASRVDFRKYVAARLEGRKQKLGWTPKRGEADSDALTRQGVLLAMGELARDPATLDEAERLARKWLANPASVPSETAQVAVQLASLRAPKARIAELVKAARAAPNPERRKIALRALGAFGDPQVLREALDVVLTDDVRKSEVAYVFWTASNRAEGREVALRWVQERWGALREKLPGMLSSWLVHAAGWACEPKALAVSKEFFTPRSRELEGAAQRLARSLDEAEQCIALQAHGSAAAQKDLYRRAHPPPPPPPLTAPGAPATAPPTVAPQAPAAAPPKP